MADNDGLKLALALSGGGARAMAFHLGCLRGLRAVGLLDKVDVISSVSGGSVLAALYCSLAGDFEAFEARTRAILRRGFVAPALATALTTPEGIKALAASTLIVLDRTAAGLFRLALLPMPARMRPRWRWLRETPLRRWASRTTILRRVFDDMLAGKSLGELRADRPKLIIVACDLMTRSAFYFAQDGIGSWRRGAADGRAVRLSHAVAASAAFPGTLPALDEMMSFDDAKRKARERVVLTDGGVYDNLGLAPLWPDRDPGISLHVERYDRLIACRAGYGLKLSPAPALWPSRMLAVVDSIHARAQNAAVQRLHDVQRAGKITGFLLPYLDQADDLLVNPPPDLVRAGAVADYPTDFSGMPEAWIDRLSKRGEQLAVVLAAQYWGHAQVK